MRKLYTEEQYIQKANEANKLGQKLYIHTFEREYERTVKDFTYEEQLQEVQVYDEEGNPLFDEEGNPITEEQLVTVAIPVMVDVEIEVQKEVYDEEGNLIVDEEGNPIYEIVTEIIQVQQTHQETAIEEVAELLIAEKGYYICYEENYTYGTENPNFEAEKAYAEAERIANLKLTGADVERGIYKAKGMDFKDITALLQSNPPVGLDLKELDIELKANHFYRGNPYVNAVGALLGFTSKQLDNFFETNNYEALILLEEEDDDNTTDTTDEPADIPVQPQDEDGLQEGAITD